MKVQIKKHQIQALTANLTIYATKLTRELSLRVLVWTYNSALIEQEKLLDNMGLLLIDNQMIMTHKYPRKRKRQWSIRSIFKERN